MDKRITPLIIMVLIVTQLSSIYGAILDVAVSGQVTNSFLDVVYTSVSYGGDEDFINYQKTLDKRIWYYEGITMRAYYLPNNDYEIDLVLKNKPDKNIFHINVDLSDYNVYFQPSLIEEIKGDGWAVNDTHAYNEELGMGVERPIEIVNSYAVYEKDSMVGSSKIGHIFRPLITDSNGIEEWGIMNYSDGVISITVNQEYLDNAIYPVIIDPTIGKTDKGGSNFFNKDNINTCQFNITENMAIHNITIYLNKGVGNTNVTCALYVSDNFNGYPEAFLVETDELLNWNGDRWMTFNFSETYFWTASMIQGFPVTLNETEITIAWWAEQDTRVYYDAGSYTNQWQRDAFAYTNNVWQSKYLADAWADRIISCYLTYTTFESPCPDIPDFGENNTLGQVIDNYVGDNFLNATYNVIRNNTLSCMELNYSLASVLTYENFTTYSELDAPNRVVVQNATWLEIDNLDLDEEVRVWRDLGADNKMVNFSGVVDVEGNGWASNGEGSFFMLSQEVDDYHTANTQEGLLLRFRHNVAPAVWHILLTKIEAGVHTNDAYLHTNDDLGEWFFMDFNRSGSSVYCDIYSDRARTTKLDTLTITLSNATIDYRYLYGMNSRNRALAGRALDYDVHRLGFWGTGYVDGHYYTENMMVNASGGTLVHLTNVTLPTNTAITVEYSNDNSTWVDHLGNAGSDTLVTGYYSIDMRNLNYTTLYQRFNLTTTDSTVTPRIFQNRIITTYGFTPTTELFYPLIIWGILATLIIAITIVLSKKRR